MRSALIISFVEWAGAFQRPQHLAMGLARRGWQVSYASPGYLHRRSRGVASGLELPDNLRVLQPPALPGSSRLRAIEAMNSWLMKRVLSGGTGTGPWDLVIFNDPRWAAVAAAVPARLRVFDCMDDLSAQAAQPDRWNGLEQRALSVADRIWTGTWSLSERLRPAAERQGKSVRFIPCGVDAGHFGHGSPLTAEQEALLPAGDGPLAGYFGAVNERFDMRRVEALMAGGPWRVLLIGPGYSRAPAMPDNPRLRWIGPRPYTELPAWLARFDVGLIPYDTSGPHRFLYPVKALEYLAGGKPVISTPLPDVVRFLSDYVELADRPDEWRQVGLNLMHDNRPALEKAARGRDYARGRSWDAMVAEMESDLQGKPATASVPR